MDKNKQIEELQEQLARKTQECEQKEKELLSNEKILEVIEIQDDIGIIEYEKD